jgi:MinD superfamily P-loop ATPase
MKKLTIISGKGGTGKTSLVGSFAALAAQKAVLVDADVDAANLSLIMKPRLLEQHDFYASRVAFLDTEKCDHCGLCRELCRFAAISEDYTISHLACEGCAFCAHACPLEAIEMKDTMSGRWFVSDTPYGFLVHARLGIAEENSGKLVTTIRNRAGEIAAGEKSAYMIIDGPPGIGCPVIASLSGVDAALIVTEPTVSGIHDLERVIALCRHFAVSPVICVNRFDIDEEKTEVIAGYCQREKISLAGKIPYDRIFVAAMIEGVPVVEYTDGPLTGHIESVWHNFSVNAK